MPSAGNSISLRASKDFQGNSALRSTSAACGATFSSQNVRRLARKSRWTSVRAKVEALTVSSSSGFSRAPSNDCSPGPGSYSVGGQVPDEQLGQLGGGHLGDPVRHVVEDLEGVGTLHPFGGLLGGRPPERVVPGGPDVERGPPHR